MKKLAVVLVAIGGLSGCIAYPVGHHHRGFHDRDRDGVANRVDHDRDGDGVRNRADRRPNNPRRF